MTQNQVRDVLVAALQRTYAKTKLVRETGQTLGFDYLAALQERGIKVTCRELADYPRALRPVAHAPEVLFYQAQTSLNELAVHTLAVVGSRRASPAGCQIAFDFALDFAFNGGCIVSGLAVGVDGAAHRGALHSERLGPTIAVLGCGLDHTYPQMHQSLRDQILSSGGAIVSEFLPEATPRPGQFLQRNQTIALLSSALLLVEAPERSGSLATARAALELGRDVYVVPGAIVSETWRGGNRLLKDGALLTLTPRDVFDSFPDLAPAAEENKIKKEVQLSPLEQAILEKVPADDETSLDRLLELGHAGGIYSALVTLEMKGLLRPLPGNRYQRIQLL